ncbi:protein disulfide isomerase [Coprinopsis marcescibilis]|uniref:protein disulfide-isomerase n=1 Tax=Coprinopsis marcescibilis TaxID=230819 RepID=A0A5C3L5S3_COPMA|nr:protein disulfide isomerase [Coprinopsis marcescibilis]
MRFLVPVFLGALVACVTASNVVTLTPDNFDSIVGKGRPALVEFYAPWCGHCKNLAPTYEELADVFSHVKDRVVIAKVDADGAGRSLGKKYGVTGFPTIYWFDEVGTHTEYKGGRDLDALAGHVSKNAGVKSKIPQPAPPPYEQLHDNNYNEVTRNPDKHVLVSFTVEAPWCRDCKDIKIVWDKVAEWFKPDDNVLLANVNLDEPRAGALTARQDIMTYPTVKFYPKGNKKGEVYDGGKTVEEIVAFLNRRTGSNRSVGGGLNLAAGLIPELDELAAKFISASKSARKDILKEAKAVAEKTGKTSGQYIKIMEKVVAGSGNYVEKERKRLKTLVAKGLDLKKQDEVKVKDNILRLFQTQKARDKSEL